MLVVSSGILEVDDIGSWIICHSPRQFPYTRIGKERGLGENDPTKIEFFRIRDNEIVPVKNISEIKRYRLDANIHTWSETGERLF